MYVCVSVPVCISVCIAGATAASSTDLTLRYLNLCQLRFQATIKSPPQRAVIWQKTNTPATEE